jgi:lipopolysaccharide cholinephosphotransferase
LIGKITKNKYSHGYGIGFYAPHKLSNCFPTSTINFEGFKFSAPSKIDEFLTEEYGDFMTIPPKEKRYFHSSKIEFFD